MVTPLENTSQSVTSCKTRETAEINTESVKEKLLLRRLKYVLKKIHQYFEQISDSNNIMYHTCLWTLLFLKVSGVKVQTKIEKYLTPR